MTSNGLYRPSSSRNWADDDDDEFDLEAWKANADTSAPVASELGPLQPAVEQDEQEPTFTVTKAVPKAINNTGASQNAPVIYLEGSAGPATIDEQVWYAALTLVGHVFEEIPDAPAYPDLSFGDSCILNPHKRVKYSSNWKKAKVFGGLDCRETALFALTPLRKVIFASGRELVVQRLSNDVNVVTELHFEDAEEFETFDEAELADEASTGSSFDTADTWERSDSDSKTEDINNTAEENSTLSTHPKVEPFSRKTLTDDFESETVDDNLEFGFADIFMDVISQDEGYQSATPSPIEENFDSKIEGAADVIDFPLRPVAQRESSARAFAVFRDQVAEGDAFTDVFEDEDISTASSEGFYPCIENNELSSENLEPAASASDEIIEVSPAQKAYDAYLAQSEEPISTITEVETTIVNDEPHEATGLAPSPPSYGTMSSPIVSASDPSSPRIDVTKPTTLIKRIAIAVLRKGRKWLSFFPGVGTIIRHVKNVLGRAREFLHQC
ncbi:hypothetical protein NX059_000926 [Plenodomus lindquistii]|nr:hypothetical protein NX059_000926 [Plenodomus lindquistii]